MTRGVLWLQVVSVVLLAGVIVYVGLGSRGRAAGVGSRAPRGTLDAAQRSRMLYANLGPCLFVLSPIDPAGGVARVLGSVPGVDPTAALLLRVFHRGGDEELSFSSRTGRLELRIDRTWTPPLSDLRATLERPDVSAATRAFLTQFVPTESLRFTNHAMGRVLYRLDRPCAWSRVDAARYRSEEVRSGEHATVRFAAASVTLVELDSLLSGGPIPAAFDPPPQRTSSVTLPGGEVK